MIYKIAKSIKSWYYFPRTRFRLLYFFSRMFNSRGPELGFVIRNLPRKKSKILEVGATESLFIYELIGRGHIVTGLDQRPYQEKLRGVSFLELDLSQRGIWKGSPAFDVITAVSVLEHIGFGEYGDTICRDGLKNAVGNLYNMLKEKGRLIATFPDSHCQRVREALHKEFEIISIEHKASNTLSVWRKKY